jgi:hypothetical protein
MWLLLAVITIASVAGLGIFRLHSMFGVHGHPVVRVKADLDDPLFDPKRVTYEVFGPATTAKIAYLDPDARIAELHAGGVEGALGKQAPEHVRLRRGGGHECDGHNKRIYGW